MCVFSENAGHQQRLGAEISKVYLKSDSLQWNSQKADPSSGCQE
jgi:hypothetical protein